MVSGSFDITFVIIVTRIMAIKKPKQETIIGALTRERGLVSPAAEALGVSRMTLHRWINDDNELQQVVEDARNAIVDKAESKLFDKIEEGDTRCVEFALRTLGKSRGYVEKKEIEQDPIKIEIVSEDENFMDDI